jgi:hypothetical protein
MNIRATAFAGAVITVAILAAGCAATGQTTTGTPPPKATAAPADGSVPSPAATFGSGEALQYDCSQLLDATSVGQLDPGLVPDATPKAPAGSSAEEALAILGTACSWTAPDGATLLVSAAAPDAATLATLMKTASSGTAVTAFGSDVTAYQSGTELQLFNADGAWATADSPLFSDSTKAQGIGSALVMALPAG